MGIGYRELADVLRVAIERGDYAPGSTLPRQGDLAVEHGVHVNTVRKAVNVLQAEGLVTAVRRRGTVVRPALTVQHLTLDRYARRNWIFGGLIDDVAGRTSNGDPITPAIHAHTVRYLSADDEIADALDIAPGDHILQRVHVTTEAGKVTHSVTSYYRREDAEGTPLDDTRPESALRVSGFQVLTLRGLEPHHITETLRGHMPSAAEKALLQLLAGEPVIETERTTYAAGERPIEYARGIHAASRFTWTYDFAVPE